MSGVVFRQSCKARSDPASAGLNVRHLQYIATRPGTVYNRGCGFGLWGRLPGDGSVRIQTDLERAKRVVREASGEHTLYRAILSVRGKDAESHGLYRRERWETLVSDHIHAVAREMGIKPENLCWCASFHCARGHPHVHLLYWDSANEPRPEVIPKKQFQAKAERIRAEFAGDIFREELLEARTEQREQLKPLRAAVQAMCLEANPEKVPDIPRLWKSAALDGLSLRLGDLIREMPARGSLRYAYLPGDYKALVNRLIDECLKQPELAGELERYTRCTEEISRLYANGESGISANREKAREKLYRELGNEVMGVLREIRDGICRDVPENRQAAGALIREAVDKILPALDSYRELCSLLPPERIPLSSMERQIPGFHLQINRVAGDVLRDVRVRGRLQSYALAAAGIDLEGKPAAHRREPGAEAAPHVLNGRALTEGEWDAYRKAYREVKQELRCQIIHRARDDAGWTREALRTGTVELLCGMAGLLSRMVSQRQAGLSRQKTLLSRDKSRDARKDYQTARDFRSEWSGDEG